jgi:hypothetical protein
VLGLVYGVARESPWWWIIIPAVGVGWYLVDRSVARKRGRPMRVYIGRYSGPWYWQAILFAMIGSGTLYHLATSHDHWYWWFLPAVAWFGFGRAVVTRKPE